MIYAISDIHGYYWEIYRWFDQMGNLAPFENGENKLVLLGDYIDYGADSFKVLRLIHAAALYLQDALVVLRGDHEEAFLEWLDDTDTPIWGWQTWTASQSGMDGSRQTLIRVTKPCAASWKKSNGNFSAGSCQLQMNSRSIERPLV